MITRLYVDNYACLTNFELKLSPTTLLVGDNGAGKTALFDALWRIRNLLMGASVQEMFPKKRCTQWSKQTRQTFELTVELSEDAVFVYRLEIDQSGETPALALEELVNEGGSLVRVHDGVVNLWNAGPLDMNWDDSAVARFAKGDESPARPFLEYMQRQIICSPLPPRMRAEANRESPEMDAYAADFVAWYRHHSQERQDAVGDLNLALRDVIDGFKGLRLNRSGRDSRTLAVAFKDPVQYELDFDDLSDGQRMLVVLYSLLHLIAERGYGLWLDEPVNFVALREIQPWIIQLADACGGEIAQAVICSHHPELIDYLGPQDGQILQRKNGGPSTVRPLHEVASTHGLSLSETLARGWEA